tara:strand:- start:1032 stop:1406 length:375 start_codon:yes stop_codon:yes gene_type:complete
MSDKDIDKEDEHLVMDLDLDVDSSIFDDEESNDDSAVSLVEDSINSSIIKEILSPVTTDTDKDIVPESYNHVLFSTIMVGITFILIGFIVGLDELIGLNCEEIGCNCGHPFIINGICDLLNGSS